MYKYLKNFFNNDDSFPPNERLWLFCMLILTSGYLGGFTFSLKGRLFVNAQTGNMVLLSTGIGTFDITIIKNTLVLLFLYFFGVMLAEYLSKKIKNYNKYLWEKTILIISLLTTFFLGFVPDTAPFEISLYPIAFIVSMQFTTFEKAQGMGMATGFCTNHLKQTATNLTRYLSTGDKSKLKISLSHLSMIFSFIVGASLAVFLGNIFGERSIWIATILFIIIFYHFNKSTKLYKKN